uniref:Chromosome 9 open reading frame 116 n=1 Tax=Steinernema glaseri TaxID=37863 RepID=A0A1I8AVY7_9BILA
MLRQAVPNGYSQGSSGAHRQKTSNTPYSHPLRNSVTPYSQGQGFSNAHLERSYNAPYTHTEGILDAPCSQLEDTFHPECFHQQRNCATFYGPQWISEDPYVQ